MKMRLLLCVLSALVFSFQPFTGSAQSTAFIYQGRLSDNGQGSIGTYDLKFSLFTAVSGGVAIVTPVTNSAVAVSNGLFSATVDFGPEAFTHYSDRYLEIAVRTNGGADFTTLTPRQFLAPTPSAQIAAKAEMATTAVTATTATTVGGDVTNQWQSDVATAVSGALNVTPRVTTEFGQTPSFSASLLTNGAIRAMFGGDSIGSDAHGGFRDILRRESVAGLQDGAFQSSFPYWFSSAQNLTSDYSDCWWSASWLATDAQEVTWGGPNGGGYKTFDTIKFWYVASPTNGSATLSMSTDNATFTPVATINTATERRLMVTNVTVPRQTAMVKMTASSNVVTVWMEVLDSQSQGARVSACHAGGKSLENFLAMGEGNIATLLTNLDPSLIVWQQLKPVSDRTNWPAMKSFFQTYAPRASVVLISGHHVTPAADIPPNTVSNMVAIDRLIATTNGWGFVDLWSGQSWSNVVASGFSSDGIHFSTPAGLQWTGNQLIDAIGLKALIATHNSTIVSNRLGAAITAGGIAPTNGTSWALTNRDVFTVRPLNDRLLVMDRTSPNSSGIWLGRTGRGGDTDYNLGGDDIGNTYLLSTNYLQLMHGTTPYYRITPAGGTIIGNVYFDQTDPGNNNTRFNGRVDSNVGFLISTNPLSTWPTAPRHGGQCFIGNSNGVIYLLTSLPNGTTWAKTNKLAP